MEPSDREAKKRKHQLAGQKAAATKGQVELDRAGRMAAWTKKHGKDDEKNPDSKQNYYQSLSKMGKH